MIRNIIFDVGNVLFKYDPSYIISSLLPKTSKKDFYLNELFLSDLWQKLDRGDLTENNVVSILKKEFKLESKDETDIRTLINEFPDYLIPNDQTIQIFKALSKKYNIYILSNFQTKPFQRLHKNYDFFNISKGIILSNDIMMKKPELGIYDYLVTKYRLQPNECLFIDDLDENITSAKRILLNGIVYKSSDQLKKELNKYSINLK